MNYGKAVYGRRRRQDDDGKWGVYSQREIEGLEFTMKEIPMDELGSINGHIIGAIIGVTAMEE